MDQTNQAATQGKGKRIEGYDVARALAILGMFIVNFKLVMDTSEAGTPLLIFLTGLLEGRAAALFVVLAGVSLSLLSQRAYKGNDAIERRKTQMSVLRRAGFLFVFGLMLAPIWPADILHFYSLYMLIGAIMLFRSDKALLQGACAFVGIFAVLFLLLDYGAGWEWESLTIIDFWTVPGMIRHLVFNGFHPVFPWAGFLLAGMWLGRQPVTDTLFRRRLIGLLLIVLVVTEGLSAVLVRGAIPFTGDEMAMMIFGRGMIPPMPFYMISAVSSAIIIIMLVIEAGNYFSQARWWQLTVTTGQFALTLYVAHIMVGMGFLEAAGWLDGSQSLMMSVVFSLIFYAAGMIFAALWRKHYKRGPFEAFMRWITK